MWRHIGERRPFGLFAEGDGGDAAAAGGGGGDAKPPTFVPTEDFKAFQQTITSTLNTMSESLRALTANRQAGNAAAEAAEARITDEQYETAVTTGDPKTIRAYLDQRDRDFKRAYIDPLEQTGLGAVAELTRASALAGKPLYTRFRSEVDQYIDSMPPASRLNPKLHQLAYEAVVGRHHDELSREATEAAMRQATQDPKAAGSIGRSTSRAAGAGGSSEVPDAKELFGAEAAIEVASKGGEDAFARRLGYDGWADYLKKTGVEVTR